MAAEGLKQFDNYQYLVDQFGEDKLSSRHAWLSNILLD